MSHFLDFSQKVVLVTGSTQGIGKATAELFAEHGATVIINCRHQEHVDSVAGELKGKGYKAIGLAADVGEEKEVRAMINTIDQRFGRLDVLVNNAAETRENLKLESIDETMWDRILKIDLGGAINITRAALALMKKQDGASIINLSSSVAFYGGRTGLHYICSKGALLSFTKGLAWELRQTGIRVNALMPPLIKTEVLRTDLAENSYDSVRQVSSLGRLGSPRDIAPVCLFLASDMANYVTGEIISLGGFLNPTIRI